MIIFDLSFLERSMSRPLIFQKLISRKELYVTITYYYKTIYKVSYDTITLDFKFERPRKVKDKVLKMIQTLYMHSVYVWYAWYCVRINPGCHFFLSPAVIF